VLSSIYRNRNYLFSNSHENEIIEKWILMQSFFYTILTYSNLQLYPIMASLENEADQFDGLNDEELTDFGSRQVYQGSNAMLEELLFNIFYPLHLLLPKKARKLLESATEPESANDFNQSLLFSYIIAEEITKCGRSVYADTKEDVEMEYNYLSGYYTDTKLFKSQDEIFYKERYLLFPYATVDSKLVLYTKLLVEAGIYDKIKEYFIIV